MKMNSETGKALHLSRVSCESRSLLISDLYSLKKELGVVLE
jgi:hypothetical protein